MIGDWRLVIGDWRTEYRVQSTEYRKPALNAGAIKKVKTRSDAPRKGQRSDAFLVVVAVELVVVIGAI